MAATQAYRPTVSQYEGTGATRLRINRPITQPSQMTVITTTQSGSNSPPQSQQYPNMMSCSSNSGNGSTVGISTITSAPNLSRVRGFLFLLHFVEIVVFIFQ